jgi:Transcriptional Coactivator p15 (PC4)
MPDERELVHSFDRSATEQVQISLSKYKGKTYADIRIYYKADKKGHYRLSYPATGIGRSHKETHREG